MRRSRFAALALSAAVAMGLGATAAVSVQAAIDRNTQQSEASPQTQKAVIQAAYNALDAMGKTLASQNKLAYDVTMVTDVVAEKGKNVPVKGTAQVRFERPNHLYVDLKTDTMERQFFHDGNQFTVIAKKEGYYGQLPATDPTRKTLITAAQKYGLEVPLVDLLEWGTSKAPKVELESARLVEETTLDGQPVEHWALRGKELEWEIWITKGEQRLPLKLTTTNYHLPEKPKFVANIQWHKADAVNSAMFAPRLSSDLKPISFNKVQPTPEATQ
ncbi:DUF2092 domain-containing protein [uncultured Microbulbifer sp.]|uniref:DUF2092 domain-containing protein n=1 Tax=uncultured Microbulbifer sp. TaxID=348147 RepID=UPI00261D5345|nr:DUF2092 domain-containing protein [uncultured Microbulbifer sp.]